MSGILERHECDSDQVFELLALIKTNGGVLNKVFTPIEEKEWEIVIRKAKK